MRRFAALFVLLLTACATLQTVTTSPDAIAAAFGDTLVRVIAHEEPKVHFVEGPPTIFLSPPEPGDRPVDDSTRLDYVSDVLARELSAELTRTWGLSFLPEVDHRPYLAVRPLDRSPPIASSLEIDLATHSLIYRPFKWNTYQYILAASARLVDASGRTVWLQSCALGGLTADKSLQVTGPQLFATDPVGYREMRRHAAVRCVKEMIDGVE